MTDDLFDRPIRRQPAAASPRMQPCAVCGLRVRRGRVAGLAHDADGTRD